MSIFISIASYRDPELVRTINSAIENADNPESLVFSVVVQDLKQDMPDLSGIKNLRLVTMHPKDARGAGYARSIAMNQYKNEDYYLQVDSHTIFAKGWDSLCIDQLKRAQSVGNNNKIILSYFPPPFHVESKHKITIVKNSKKQPPYPTRQIPKLTKRSEWTADRLEFVDKDRPYPELSTTVLGGFIFATGNIVKEVPYDPDISFFGEEICFALRAWTRGWDIYSPSEIIVYHFYTREGYKKIWKDRNLRSLSWKEIEYISAEKQKKVLCGIEKGIFGAGETRSIYQYEQMIGIDFKRHYGLTNTKKQDTIEQ